MNNLLDLTANELLDLHSQDNPVPGAGSMAAINSLNAASAILKVIKITRRKKNYDNIHEFLDKKKVHIINVIKPRLKQLHQEDAIKFKIHIDFRIKALEANNIIEKQKILESAKASLKPCIEIPLEIAELSVELLEISSKLVEYGFFAVGAEANTALNNCNSAIGSCISTVELNLCYLEKSEWTLAVDQKSKKLSQLFKTTSKKIIEFQNVPRERRDWNWNGLSAFRKKFSYSFKDSNLKTVQIKDLVSDLNDSIYAKKNSIWKSNIPRDYFEIIQPKKVLNLLGYQYIEETTLGQYFEKGKAVEVAGITDHKDKFVAISTQFSPESRYFTLCHELGHVIMHNGKRIYRDGPLDGKYNRSNQDWTEYQANVFAKNYSMPEELVIKVFEMLYGTNRLIINADTLFKLNKGSMYEFKQKYPSLRNVTRLIAGTEFYDHQNFKSISKIFKVSNTAMAIRLEELRLIIY